MSATEHQRYALTLHPEWAFAVAHLGKDIENRTWFDERVRGRWLAIHGGACVAGAPIPKWGPKENHLRAVEEVRAMAEVGSGLILSDGELNISRVLAEGRGIVAIARVCGTVKGSVAGWYIGDPSIGWKLDRVTRLPHPIRCIGRQGLWELSSPIIDEVRRQLAEVASRRGARS